MNDRSGATAGPEIAARFWRHVEKGADCWFWKGNTVKGGYGQFGIDADTKVMAHRFAWELCNGPIPEGLTLDHLCLNTPCVRPDHMEPVSLRVNILRGNGWAARNARRSSCIHGHPLSHANIYVDHAADGTHRRCRECQRRKDRARAPLRAWRRLQAKIGV